LVSGDTLFVQGCGRVDLPGSDPEEMYRTLTERLAKLPDDVVLYPGHDYGDRPESTLGRERQTNTCLQVPTLQDWLRLMGG
jgi:glyoxylase-like metal-dependent hydrolase (beta-lactamase superfamily II)